MSYKKPRPTKYRPLVKRGVAGLGLFTDGPIDKDDFVIEYYGPLMNVAQANAKSGKYQFAVDKQWTIDGSSRQNLARYINHSCRPNCEVELDGKRVFIYAIKPIDPGEEITYHYGKEYFDDYIKPHGCKCGHHRPERI